MATPETPTSTESGMGDRLHGFSLQSVCWGYRELFARAIDDLYGRGLLGSGRKAATETFFAMLRLANRRGFEHVLKEFVTALNGHARWMMAHADLLAEVVKTGRAFAESKIYLGTGYFHILGEGGFGSGREEVHILMHHLRRLRMVDELLAFAFLKGYGRLAGRLDGREISRFVTAGLEVYARNQKSGISFMEGTLRGSEATIRSLAKEVRLVDVEPALSRLLRALTGREVKVDHLGKLESDPLIERGTRVVCLYRWLYLPAGVRHFETARANRSWYTLMAIVAAGMILEGGFPAIHGHPGYRTCRDLVGEDPLKISLFGIAEYARVLARIRERWPGARRLLELAIRTEFTESPAVTPTDRLLEEALTRAGGSEAARVVRGLAADSVNCFDTAARLEGDLALEIGDACPGLGSFALRTSAFLPDFLYPGEVSEPPPDAVVFDLKRAAERSQKGEPSSDEEPPRQSLESEGGADEHGGEEEASEAIAPEAVYVYDEWSQTENDYYRNHCFVRERRAAESPAGVALTEGSEEARRVRRLFEMLRPDESSREKYLPEGDEMNPDLLLDYIVQRREEPSPRVRFYERPRVNRRDLAVQILLDVSGSMGEAVAAEKAIDVEKRAAAVFAEGLAAIGDRFSVSGFSGSGRENCEYFVYKDFDEPWDRQAAARVLSARPLSSTRIGAALRHSGFRLSRVAAKQRLIILVSDARPMDSGYDPNTRYAQHDVRMACEECRRHGIHTVCISTEENSPAEMATMFPNRRFVILRDMRSLVRVLPELYVKLTA